MTNLVEFWNYTTFLFTRCVLYLLKVTSEFELNWTIFCLIKFLPISNFAISLKLWINIDGYWNFPWNISNLFVKFLPKMLKPQELLLGGIHKLRKQDFANFWHPPRPPSRKQVYYISLCIMYLAKPLPLACLRSLWMPPLKSYLILMVTEVEGKVMDKGDRDCSGERVTSHNLHPFLDFVSSTLFADFETIFSPRKGLDNIRWKVVT